MGKLTVMNHTGDSQFKWDPATGKGLSEAETQFKELSIKGHMFHSDGKVIRRFDKEAEEIIAHPQLQGG
jgi:hypothetical protein